LSAKTVLPAVAQKSVAVLSQVNYRSACFRTATTCPLVDDNGFAPATRVRYTHINV